MRFTLLHPDPVRGPGLHPTDVEADPGIALSAMRPALSRVSGYGGWVGAGVCLAVADVPLDDHHVVGQPPLVEGCVLRVGVGPRPPAEIAALAPWHVAVVAGPDCGSVLALPEGVVTTLRPGGGGPDVLAVRDPTLELVHVRRRGERVRLRVGRRGRWRPWRPDDPRRSGATTLVLRRAHGGAVPIESSADEPRTFGSLTTWLTSAVGSLALALALRQPLLLLAGLAAPAVALATAGLRAWRRRRAAPADPAPRDPAALAVATSRARYVDAEPVVVEQPWDPGGSLAVVGPRHLALPVARAVVLGVLGTHLAVPLTVHTRHADDWAWGVWASDGPGPGALVVADDPGDAAALARWRSSAPPAERLLLLAETAADVPAWCRARLEVGPRSVLLRDAAGSTRAVPVHAVTAAHAGAQVRAAAAARASADRRDTPGVLPGRASLGALDGIPAPDQVASSWAVPRTGLVAALGVGPDGRTLAVDLVTDGPHVLVAGTTGAGKSELLTTLVLALALTHPPDRLTMLLVDFKGGTGLGPVARLPHVLEHVTDLDATHARRVLTALRAELRRRERVLAAVGARDLVDLDPAAAGTPPRLLVVVDELRALTEDVPDASGALARIAAQGRALGVHLVLATQRPAGAVGADLRANVALRVALRVADVADSTDVLDAPDAARIDPTTPGRAWLRRGTRPLEPVQVARAVATSAVPVVRPARPWPDGAAWTPRGGAPREAADAIAAWVRAADEAARAGRPRERPPWFPALPEVVRRDDVPDGPGLALAVADLPEQLRRAGLRWDPSDGHLLALGGPRSGRSTTLLTLGIEALEHGWHVHAVGLPAGAVDRLRAGDRHGGLGSALDTDDARATARLLELLAAPTGARALLLVDRLDLALESLGRLAHGAGADRLTALWRGASGRTAIAACADAGASALQHAGAFSHRLVLPLADPTLDAHAGVPSALAGPRRTPGRAVHLHPGGAELCQVALPAPPTGDPAPATSARRPVLVRALPDRVELPEDPIALSGTLVVPLGHGGDDAGIVQVDLAHGLLVAGPPGSGRTSTLAVLARSLVRAGGSVLRVVDPTVPAPPGFPGVEDVALVDLVAACRDASSPPVVLVDDLDELERSHPSLDEVLAATPAVGVVATVTSAAAAQAFRGALPALLRRRRTLVLDVHDPASAELAGPHAAFCVDPLRRPPGRGVLLTGRDVVVVQVYAAPTRPDPHGAP